MDAGFEVLAWDGPSHGESPGTRTNLGDFARSLLEVQKEVGAVHALIGHSFGAASSVLAAGFGLQVQQMILISCPCSAQDVFDRFTKLFSFSHRISRSFQELVEEKAGLLARDAQVHQIAPKLSVHALVIHDRRDKEIPYADAVKISEHWPQAQFITTEGLGHRRILYAEDVVRQSVQFLTGAKLEGLK